MSVITKSFTIKTKGDTDILDITHQVKKALKETQLKNGISSPGVLCPGYQYPGHNTPGEESPKRDATKEWDFFTWCVMSRISVSWT